MTIREVILYQVACDECGRTAFDMEAWTDTGGLEIGDRHACHNTGCGIAFLDSHPNLIARGAANGADRWWVVFDWKWSEYVAFFAYRGGPNLIESDGSLATVMDEVWAW